MTIRKQNLETIAPVLATFKIARTGGIDNLKDADLGKAVTLTGNNEIGPCTDNSILLGKLIALTLTDSDDGERQATVQIGGICRLAVGAAYPVAGDRVVGAADGKVKQSPALAGSDPAGGNIARGTVLEVNGTIDCTLYLN